MSSLIIAIGLALLFCLLVGALVHSRRPKGLAEQTIAEKAPEEITYGDPQVMTCDYCRVILTPETHHKIRNELSDSSQGSDVAADFCPEHCEGECDRGCEKRGPQLGDNVTFFRRSDLHPELGNSSTDGAAR